MKKVIAIANSTSAGRAAAPAFAGGELVDTRGRAMHDLRISVTDRCNFRCVYCMPREAFGADHPFLPYSAILTFEEITRLARIFVELGVMHSVKDARDSLDVATGDAPGGVFPTDPRFGARGQEPSYLKVIDGNGAFFAWTRGSYYFSAHAKSGEAALDAFVQAFPY